MSKYDELLASSSNPLTHPHSGEKAAPIVPSTTQFMNLSAYMYQAYDTPYTSTPLQDDIGFKPLTTARGKIVMTVDDRTGLYAEAFVSTGSGPKQVVVAYEGTNLFGQSAAFTGAQAQDDAMLFNGQNALSFAGAAAFARSAIRVARHQGVGRDEVFVTGHSLGAAEAEYAAGKTGLAGTTFAGPGIPQSGLRSKSNLTNYVDAGDPVGNYAGDTVLAPVVTSSKATHYGAATILTNTSDGPNNNVNAQMLLQGVAESWPSLGKEGKEFVVADVAKSNLFDHNFHALTQYASDLNVDLYTTDNSDGAGKDFLPTDTSQSQKSALAAPRVLAASASNDTGGSDVGTACYVTGTSILTTRGDVAVEALAVGDLVVTASGAHRPIKWIGHRAYAGRFANTNPDVLPICFKTGSLGDAVPARDLWVSPKHAMFLDDALFPAEVLVNGVSVVKAERVESVTYWHVELDSHDVLIAEGAASESFVDDHSRGMFHNARTFAALYPDEAAPVAAVYCAPRIEDGHRLEVVRRAIAARAGIASEAPDCGALHGYIESMDGEVRGWVRSALNPAMPVCLDLVVDGQVVGHALANRPRADLEAAGYGPHAFAIAIPADAAGKRIEIRRSADGATLKAVWDKVA